MFARGGGAAIGSVCIGVLGGGQPRASARAQKISICTPPPPPGRREAPEAFPCFWPFQILSREPLPYTDENSFET